MRIINLKRQIKIQNTRDDWKTLSRYKNKKNNPPIVGFLYPTLNDKSVVPEKKTEEISASMHQPHRKSIETSYITPSKRWNKQY